MKAKSIIALAALAACIAVQSLNAALVRIWEPDRTTKPGFVINTFSNTVSGVVRARTNDLSKTVARRANVSARGSSRPEFGRARSPKASGSFLTMSQEEFYRSYTRQVAQEIIVITNVPHVVATWRKGDEVWQTTNVVKVIQGRQQTDKLGEVDSRVKKLEKIFPVHYSKLKLITNLKAVGKWKDVKAQLEAADVIDEWNASMFVLDTHPFFIAATNNAVQKGVCTVEQIEALLKNSIDE